MSLAGGRTMSEKIEMPVKDLLYRMYALPVAIVQELYPILGREKTLRLMKDTVHKATMKEKNPRLNSFEEFVTKGGSELVRKTTESRDLEFKQNPPSMSFKITKCMWSEVFKSMNATEIGEVLVCESDFPRAKTWNPKLELKRTQTIMGGAPYCDFCYQWKE
jgi:hypothetical protein